MDFKIKFLLVSLAILFSGYISCMSDSNKQGIKRKFLAMQESIDQELLEAVKENNLEEVKDLLQNHHANINIIIDDGIYSTIQSPLLIAMRSNKADLEMVKYLIANGANINFPNTLYQRTFNILLMILADLELNENGSINQMTMDKIKCLIGASDNLEITDHIFGVTAIVYSIWINSYEIFIALAEKGANINFEYSNNNPRNNTPLILVINNYFNKIPVDKKIAEYLINNADLNLTNINGDTVLMIYRLCKDENFNNDIVKMLIENGADPSIRNKNNESALDDPRIRKIYEEYKIGIDNQLECYFIKDLHIIVKDYLGLK